MRKQMVLFGLPPKEILESKPFLLSSENGSKLLCSHQATCMIGINEKFDA